MDSRYPRFLPIGNLDSNHLIHYRQSGYFQLGSSRDLERLLTISTSRHVLEHFWLIDSLAELSPVTLAGYLGAVINN